MGDDIATNRKSARDFTILETIEAGLVLKGTEVKVLREGRANLNDCFARIEKDEAWLYQLEIPHYEKAGPAYQHEPKAVRRLLLHKAEIRKLFGQISIKGRTLVALKMYWKNNCAKVLLGVGIGKNQRDKREDLKKADAKREIAQAIKSKRH